MPPQDLDAEMAVLGCMILDDKTIYEAMGILDPEDFYKESHMEIFRAISDIDHRGEKADLVTLTSELKRSKKLDECGGVVYITTLIDSIPTTSNVKHYANIVKEKSIGRKIIMQSTQLISEAFSEEKNSHELLIEAQKGLLDLSLSSNKQEASDIKSVIDETMKVSEEYEKRGYIGLKTGFKFFDSIIGGYIPGFLWVITAWTSSGKSSLMIEMVRRLYAANSNPHVMIVSTEMTRVGNLLKLVSNYTGVPPLKILEFHKLYEADQSKVAMRYGMINDFNLDIYDSLYKWDDIYINAKKNKISKGLDVVFIDFIQNIQGQGTIYERMSVLGPNMQNMAKELECTVIGLSQVSNEDAGGSEHFKAKGAGEIAAAADIGIHLARVKDENKDLTEELTVSVKKNRWNMLGSRTFSFTDRYTRITE